MAYPIPLCTVLHVSILVVSLLAAASAVGLGPPDLRIAFLTDCSTYSAWQSVGMAFAFQQTRQPGAMTRIMCCTDQEREQLERSPVLRDVMPTHIAKSFTWNPELQDFYQAYNKPGALLDWLGQVTPTEQYVMVVDSDMYVRRPLHQKLFNVSKGWAVSADYTYLDGVSNELWTRYIPHIPARNDTLAGPVGRHADQVGGWLMIDREDLKKVAPQWLNITKAVRADPEAWRLCGDKSVAKGERPWISEMYGYVYAAANNSVWHTWDTSVMRYPGYIPSGVPKIIHYGLRYDVGAWSFDKHWHFGFNITDCAPWDLSSTKARNHGIFPSPPRPSTLPKVGVLEHYRDLLAIETVSTLNAGFCYFHLQHCPAHPQLLAVCQEVLDLYNEIEAEVKEVELKVACADFKEDCVMWAGRGECGRFAAFMSENCRAACGLCNPLEQLLDEAANASAAGKLPTEVMAEMLVEMKVRLQAKDAAAVTAAGAAAGASPQLPSQGAAGSVEDAGQAPTPSSAVVAAGGAVSESSGEKRLGLLRGGAGLAGRAAGVGTLKAGNEPALRAASGRLGDAALVQQEAASPAADGSESGSASSNSSKEGARSSWQAGAKASAHVSAAVLDAGLGGLEGPHSWGQVLLCGVGVVVVMAVGSRFHWHARHPNCHVQ